ncbi:MAG: WG repeat-containing protein [Luteolibacter sp.]
MTSVYKSFGVVLIVVFSCSVASGQERNATYIPGQEGYPFSEGLAPIYDSRYWKDTPENAGYEIFGKYGFIDKKGRLVIPFLYEKAGEFNDGLAPVAARRSKDQNELSYGYVNPRGEEVIPLHFQDARPFSEGFAAVKQAGKWRFIDINGNFTIKENFDDAQSFSEGLAAVKLEETDWGFIDTKGKLVIPFAHSSWFKFSDGLSAAGTLGTPGALINRKGEVSVTFRSGAIPTGAFSEGLITLSGGIDKKSGQTLRGFGDKEGNIVIPLKYEGAYDFHEGLAAVRKDGKYGFIDKNGDLRIPHIFIITEGEFLQAPPVFSEGLAFVKGGYIDKQGEWVLRTYDTSGSNSK